MDTNAPAAFTLGFSTEELIYLLDSLGIPQILGLNRDPFDELPEAQQIMILDAARRALLARQVLRPGDGGLQLDPLVFELLKCCLSPDHTIIVSRKGGGVERRDYYFHSREDIHLLHWLSDQEVHQYVLLSERSALQSVVLEFLGLAAENGKDAFIERPAMELEPAAFEQARGLAVEQALPAEAERILFQNGMDPIVASSLAACLAGPHVYRAVVAFDHRSTSPAPRIKISLVYGPTCLWSIKDIPGASQWRLQATCATAVEQQIREFITEYQLNPATEN